jgi:hypothetical protein
MRFLGAAVNVAGVSIAAFFGHFCAPKFEPWIVFHRYVKLFLAVAARTAFTNILEAV